MRKEILPYYRALGLNPGAGPEEIRRAWKQMVQQWHPDLYKPGSLMQKTAEDITKEVNEAYGQLYRKKLYRQFPPREERGEEPEPPAAKPPEARPAAPPQQPRTPPTARRPARARKAPRAPRPTAPAGGYVQWEDRLLRILRGRGTKKAFAVAIALAAIPVGWALWESLPAFTAPARPEAGSVVVDTGEAPRQANPSAAASAALPAVPATPVRDFSPPAYETDVSLREFTGDASLRALAVSTESLIEPLAAVPVADPDPLGQSAALIAELFEMGDTKAKVLAIEGSPDNAGDTVYRYGSSLVYFRDGRVRGWVDRLPRLRVRAWESVDGPSIERFSLGSSRNEVVRAQGAPGTFTTDTYLFGSSAVYFSQGRVSGWSEGGVVLKALNLPQLPFRDPEPNRH